MFLFLIVSFRRSNYEKLDKHLKEKEILVREMQFSFPHHLFNVNEDENVEKKTNLDTLQEETTETGSNANSLEPESPLTSENLVKSLTMQDLRSQQDDCPQLQIDSELYKVVGNVRLTSLPINLTLYK